MNEQITSNNSTRTHAGKLILYIDQIACMYQTDDLVNNPQASSNAIVTFILSKGVSREILALTLQTTKFRAENLHLVSTLRYLKPNKVLYYLQISFSF